MDQAGRSDSEPQALNKHACQEDAQVDDNKTAVGTASPEDVDDGAEYAWQTAGHEFLGRFVARPFGRSIAIGNISRWLPPEGDDGALFHVSHLDGDEEDLDQEEAEEAFERYQKTGHCREEAKRKEDTAAHLLGPLALSVHRLLQLHPHCASLAQCDAATQAAARQATERATAALHALNETLQASLGLEVEAVEGEDLTKTKPEGQDKGTASYIHASVPSASVTSRPPPPVHHGQSEVVAPKAKGGRVQAVGAPRPFVCAIPGCNKDYTDQQGLDQHQRLKHPELSAPGEVGAGIGIGSRVQDSEGICGELVARNGAWLTMRTDAGEERKMRKADVKLIAPEMEAAPQAMAAPEAAVELQAKAAPEAVAAPPQHLAGPYTAKVMRPWQLQAGEGDISVGSRVQDSEGTCGEIVARSGAWLTMRTDAGKERSIRKANLELLTPGAPKIAPTWPRDAEGAQAPASTAASVEAARFKTGDLVIIDGLTSKPELNGCKAHVRGSDPAKVGRFILDLLHNGTQISVKSINCRPPPGHAPFDRKQVARGPSQTTRKRGRAAVETTDESDSPSDQSETEGDGDADDLPDPVQMKRDHEWVGRTVHVRFGHQIMSGKVVGWYPTQGGDEALWHVVHEDDDEEDLDEEEMRAALLLNPADIRQSARETKVTDRMTASLLAERAEAGCRSYDANTAEGKPVRFHLVPRIDWLAFPRRAGGGRGRNELDWKGDGPLPPPPNPRCWLLPSEDQVALVIAQSQPALAAAGWRVLTSPAHVVARLGDKAAFHAHAAAAGLGALLPQHYASFEAATYPCILKAARGAYGSGTHIVHSVENARVVAHAVGGELGVGWVLQELVRGRVEIATSLLIHKGRVLQAATTSYTYDADEYVWPHVKEKRAERTTAAGPPAQLGHMLALLGNEFQGICNFNYKLRSDATLCVFEVNPRMGSDLGCDVPMRVLRGFLGQLDALPVDAVDTLGRGDYAAQRLRLGTI